MIIESHSNPLETELAALRRELAEAKETLEAIHSGAVDALVVVPGPGQDQIFTLGASDFPYQALIERMHEGAATLSNTGTVL